MNQTQRLGRNITWLLALAAVGACTDARRDGMPATRAMSDDALIARHITNGPERNTDPPSAGTPEPVFIPTDGGCGGNLFRCGDACVNLGADPEHCGDCETVCPIPQACQGGKCGSGSATVNAAGKTSVGSVGSVMDGLDGKARVEQITIPTIVGTPMARAVATAGPTARAVATASSTARAAAKPAPAPSNPRQNAPVREDEQGAAGYIPWLNACAPGFTFCQGLGCINLNKNDSSCGKCEVACSAGTKCRHGRCEAPNGEAIGADQREL